MAQSVSNCVERTSASRREPCERALARWITILISSYAASACSSASPTSPAPQSSEPSGAPSSDTPDGDSTSEVSALLGRWWGYSGAARVVLEILDSRYDQATVRVHGTGPVRETSVRGAGRRWRFGQALLDECIEFELDSSGDVATCHDRNGAPGDVLRRSRATRLLSVEPAMTVTTPAAAVPLAFDRAEQRFGFRVQQQSFVWDDTERNLHALGETEPHLVFADDGKHAVFLRRGPTSNGNGADLVLFDATNVDSKVVATDVAIGSAFAQFSPNSEHLLFLANTDGSAVDLLHLRLGGTSPAPLVRDVTSTQPYFVFGPTADQALFSPSISQGAVPSLSHLDLTTDQVASISGAAHDVAPWPDGSRLAFTERDGTTRLWDWTARSAEVLQAASESYPVDSTYRSGFTISTDGRFFAFVTPSGSVHAVDTTGEFVNLFGAQGALCFPESKSERPQVAVFAENTSGMVHWPTRTWPESDCSSGRPTVPLVWQDFVGSPPLYGPTLGASHAWGPSAQVLNDEGAAITFWSPTTDHTEVVELGAHESLMQGAHAPVFARDASLVVFSTLEQEGLVARLHAWDVERARAHELTRAPLTELHYAVDTASGAVIFIDDDKTLKLWSPRDTTTKPLLDEAVTLIASTSGATIIVEGKRETERGAFLLRFDAASPRLLEAGSVLAVSDTTLFFQAADGVLAYSLVTDETAEAVP